MSNRLEANIRIALVQYEWTELEDETTFWQQLEAYFQEALTEGAQLVVFPEYLTGHLLALREPLTHEQACVYLSTFSARYLERFSEWSRRYQLTILAGTHIFATPAGYQNVACLFMADGTIHRQVKIHLTPEERMVWGLVPGDDVQLFDVEGVRCAILTCYDIEFPESARYAAEKGAHLILCPSYTDTAAGFHRVHHCCRARAIENQLFVALSGSTGELAGVQQIDRGYTQAGLFAPCDHPFPADGTVALGKRNRRQLLIADADFSKLGVNHREGTVTPFFDRKCQIYRQWMSNIVNQLKVRPYNLSDRDELIALQKAAFPAPYPEDQLWNVDQIRSHIEVFQSGAMAAFVDGQLVGSCTSLLIHYDGKPHNWYEISDNGYIRASHQADGDSLYGIDLCVHPAFRGRGVAKALYNARKELVMKLGLKRFIAACRIPNFKQYSDRLTCEEYVGQVFQGELYDPVLTFIFGQQLQPLQILDNYLEDEESLNKGVLVEWRNPDL